MIFCGSLRAATGRWVVRGGRGVVVGVRAEERREFEQAVGPVGVVRKQPPVGCLGLWQPECALEAYRLAKHRTEIRTRRRHSAMCCAEAPLRAGFPQPPRSTRIRRPPRCIAKPRTIAAASQISPL